MIYLELILETMHFISVAIIVKMFFIFFLKCPLYLIQTEQMLTYLENYVNHRASVHINLILSGNAFLSLSENQNVSKSLHIYIHNTKRL